MNIMSIITLIMTIISLLTQLFNPTPTPTPTPTPVAAMMDSMVHVNCADAQWNEARTLSNAYVQGSMVQNCTVKMDAIALSSQDAMDRLTSDMLNNLEQNPSNQASNEAYELSSSVKRDFDSQQVLQVNGQSVPVGGKVSFLSDRVHSLTTQYQAQTLPTKGDASYLKSLNSLTEIGGDTDPTTFNVQITTTTQIEKPFLANASHFKSLVVQQLKQQVQQRAQDTVSNLVNSLR